MSEQFERGDIVYTITEDGYGWLRCIIVDKYDYLKDFNVYTLKLYPEQNEKKISRTSRQVFRTKDEAINLGLTYIKEEIRIHKKAIRDLELNANILKADLNNKGETKDEN